MVYTPGKLEAVGYNNGVKCAEKSFETCGEPVALKLELDTPDVKANGCDAALLSCKAVDEAGREIPLNSVEVEFAVSGAGKLIGTGSDNTDHVPVPSCRRKMYGGIISAAVRCLAEKEGATFTVYAAAPGLKTAVIEVKTLPEC